MNVNGPRRQLTFAQLLRLAGDQRIAWVNEQALLDAGVEPWTELPLWLPESFDAAGMMDMDTARAQAAGLRTRPPSTPWRTPPPGPRPSPTASPPTTARALTAPSSPHGGSANCSPHSMFRAASPRDPGRLVF